MAREAIISDIHGNYQALKTVLEHIDALEPQTDRVVCLGDVIGYGPQPVECLQAIMERCAFTLLGNHEFAVLHDTEGFNPIAEQAIKWTRDQIKDKEQLKFLQRLKSARLEGDVLYVHASVKDPLMDYVREPDSHESFMRIAETLEREFRYFDLCFTGHNHRAFLATQEGFIYPHAVVSKFHVRKAKLYVCVGSVGQPRDENPRASYTVYDGQTVEYHRVDYDIEATAEKIREAGLHEFLAERLFSGV